MMFNPLNAELNPICHLLVLLGAHHILHVSRIRVKEIVGISFEIHKKRITVAKGYILNDGRCYIYLTLGFK